MGTTAAGHAQVLTVERAGPDTLTVAPGARGSVAFQVVNQGSQRVTLRLALDAPDAWRVVAPATDLALAGGGSALRIVTFFAPADAPAGAYSISLTAHGDVGRASDRVGVRVRAKPELRAEVDEAPLWATAGEPYSVRFRVTNTGNVPLTFRPRLESPHGFRTRADTLLIRLDPGGSAVVPVIVLPPEELARAVEHGLRLRAIAEGDSAEVIARVEVVPRGRTAREPRGGLPLEVRLRASADPRAGPPVRVRSSGPVRPGSDTRFEVLLQGPTQAYSVFGEADVYRFRLESPHLSFGLGDDVYRLSRLTEPGQEGLGAGASARAGPFEAGGYVQRDRRSFQPDTQYAAFAGASLGGPLQVRANWLRRDSREGRREVVSGQAALRVADWFSLDGEYGWRPGKGAEARTVDLTGSRGPVTIALRHMRADSTYGGPYAGYASDGAHVRLLPGGQLFIEGSVEDQSIRRQSGTLDFVHSHRSVRFATGWGSAVNLEAHHLERTSRSGTAYTEREAQSIQLRVGIPLGPVNLFPSVEAGTGEDRVTNESSSFWRAGLRSRIAAGPGSLSTSVHYFTGGTLHRSAAEEGVSGTASASLQVRSSLKLHASAYATHYLTPVRRSNLVINGMVDQRLPFGHLLSARVLSRAATGVFEHRETIALFDYTIPLTLPLGRAPGPASVVGRIFDAETGDPLRRVIVRVGGRRVATDADGRVAVGGLEPGTHYVDIDRSTLEAGGVPGTPMPLRLEVRSGRRTEFEVGVVAGGALAVGVRLIRGTSITGRGSTPGSEPFGRVLLEFRSGEERFRRPTDASGRIELTGLRPGEWIVEVVHADLPAFHRFEQDSVSLTVEPGEETELELVARPVERRMEVVATGELRVERVGEAREQRGVTAPEVAGRLPEDQERVTFRVPMTMTLWEVAWLVYRDSALWPKIWVANRDGAPDPAAVPRGLELRIPPKGPLNEAERRARGEQRQYVAAPRTTHTTFRPSTTTSLWEVAWRVYGDRDLWPKIWLANRAQVPDPGSVHAGALLQIPPVGPLTAAERDALEEYRGRPPGAPR